MASIMHGCIARLPQGTSMIINARDGRRFVVDPREPQYRMGLLDLGTFEPVETRIVSEHVQPGFTVVDAGANFGWYSTLFSRLTGPAGRVHAFEPMPATADALERNCRLNRCENVIANRCALGERSGRGLLFQVPGKPCGDASLFWRPEAEAPHDCEIITLDAYASREKLTRCDLIKCDVEGAELSVLRGASALLHAHRPAVLLEVNPAALRRAGCNGRDLLEELRRHGKYVFRRIDAAVDGDVVIEPADCETIGTYANVLCVPAAPGR